MIDTHAHIDDPIYKDDLDAFLAQQKAEGVEAILVPGVDAASIEPVLTISQRYPNDIFPGIGLHPENVKEDYRQQLEDIHSSLINNHYIAVGEIGLDYHFDTTFKAEQQIAFRTQLQWALDLDLPVMIHSRDATEDTLRIIKQLTSNDQRLKTNNLRGVFHCFSGSNETAKEIIKMGFYLGIGGVITFKNCKLRDNLSGIPLERLVLETDAPYMAPVPFRGKRNESRWMRYVADVLAQVYQTTFEHINDVTTANAKALFRLNCQGNV